MARTQDDDHADMSLLLHVFMVLRMLGAVADHAVVDALPSGDVVVIEALAGSCGVQPRPLLRVLRRLAAQNFFSVGPGGAVVHTGCSRLLRQAAADSLRHAARPEQLQASGAL